MLNIGDAINKINTIISLLVFILVNLIYFFAPVSLEANNLISFFVALSGIIFIISISSYLNISMVLYIGQNSMVIYLLHLIFTSGSRILLLELGVDDLLIQIVLGVFMGIVGPIVILICTKYLRLDKILF